MPVAWMQYRNKPILFADYRGLERRHKARLVRRQARELDHVEGSVGIICRFDGAALEGGTMRRALSSARAALRLTSGRGAVVVGNPVSRAILHLWTRLTGPHLVPFSTEQEALEWVIR